MSADTPHLIGDCIDASMTVTLGTPKLPLVLPPGEEHAGDIMIADIGIPDEVIEAVEGQHIELLTREQLRDVVQPRAADSHKGDYGRVTIVAGSRGKTGAATSPRHGGAAIRRRARDGRDTRLVARRSSPRWPRKYDRAAGGITRGDGRGTGDRAPARS